MCICAFSICDEKTFLNILHTELIKKDLIKRNIKIICEEKEVDKINYFRRNKCMSALINKKIYIKMKYFLDDLEHGRYSISNVFHTFLFSL